MHSLSEPVIGQRAGLSKTTKESESQVVLKMSQKKSSEIIPIRMCGNVRYASYWSRPKISHIHFLSRPHNNKFRICSEAVTIFLEIIIIIIINYMCSNTKMQYEIIKYINVNVITRTNMKNPKH